MLCCRNWPTGASTAILSVYQQIYYRQHTQCCTSPASTPLPRSGGRYLLSVSWAARSSLALAWLSRDGARLGVELCTIATSRGAQCRQVAL